MSSLRFDRTKFACWLVALAFIASSAAQAADPAHVLARPTSELKVVEWQRSAAPKVDGDLSEWPALAHAQASIDAAVAVADNKPQFTADFRADHSGLFVAAIFTPLQLGEYLQFTLALETNITLPANGSSGVALSIMQDCRAQIAAEAIGKSKAHPKCAAFLAVNLAHQKALLQRFRREFSLSAAGFLQSRSSVRTWPSLNSDWQAVYLPEPGVSHFAQQLHASHWQFEWQLPWAALPLTDQRVLEQLYLRIERCAGKNCVALLPANSKSGLDALALRLPAPKFYQLTHCGLPLIAPYRDYWYSAYFQPQASATIDTVFAIAEPYGEYFREPDPARLVPEVARYQYSETKLGADEYVCGPLPFYRNRKLTGSTLFALHPESAKASNTGVYRSMPYTISPVPLKIEVLSPQFALVHEPLNDFVSGSLEGAGAAEPQSISKVWLLDRKRGTWMLLFEESQSVIFSSFYPNHLNSYLKQQNSLVFAEVSYSADLRKINIQFAADLEAGFVQREVLLCLDLKARAYKACQR
jgi:hypothetical protein